MLAAIDLETAPDPCAIDLLAGRRDRPRPNAAVHRISAAAWLVMAEDAAGNWSIVELASQGEPDEEFDILLSLNRVLKATAESDGEIVTYNGLRHDMPVIRRRGCRHWMVELDGLFPSAPIRHRDVMRTAGTGIGEWPTLREACAGLGFSCDPEYDDIGGGHRLAPRRRKAETDAVATMILCLHELSAERREVATLARAWSALAAFISCQRPQRPHLLQFCRSPDLEGVIRVERDTGLR